MATGLLIATLSLALAAAGWVVWRERAERARREEVRLALGSLVEDGTNLLTATLVGLDAHSRRAKSPELDVALDGARAASRLLEAAHALAEDPERRLARAEGCIRVAVAIARSRGARVMLRGTGTEMASSASVEVTCRTLGSLVERAWKRSISNAQGLVTVSFHATHLELEGPFDAAEESVRLEACGWALRHVEGDERRWTLRPTTATDANGPVEESAGLLDPSA